MKYFLSTFLLGLFSLSLSAQLEPGLVAYYSFDDCTVRDSSGVNSQDGVFVGSPDCVCGVSGNAIQLNGFDEQILLLGSINNYFETGDITISFYIKSTSAAGTQSVFSRRETCGVDNTFGIRINPAANTLSVDFYEEAAISGNVDGSLDFGSCWQHIVIVRGGALTSLYINAQLVDQTNSTTGARVNIRNNGVLNIGGGPCVSEAVDNRFAGIIDEVKIYERAFNQQQVEGLYLAPDRIATVDTTVFLGNSVNLRTTETCASDLEWMPADGLDDPTISNPVATPDSTTTYSIVFDDGICAAVDSVTVTVINPDDLGCSVVYMPKAFTPNSDNLNDQYGISNPYAIDQLVSFEIFDRWGSRVFATDDPFERWDGNFKGEPVNPGVLLYRVQFRCNGEEDTTVGSFAVIR